MTICELTNALDGFEELKKEQFQEYMIGVRVSSFWSMKAMGSKLQSPDKLFPLESDKQARKNRIRKMKPIEVTRGK